ncbi:MAG: hypothetical protein QOJ86_255 [Bradyrhizobium sp.]|nr:hypothetical protein [Bradyrhizobium sp.]
MAHKWLIGKQIPKTGVKVGYEHLMLPVAAAK